jgi:hypothetical protein
MGVAVLIGPLGRFSRSGAVGVLAVGAAFLVVRRRRPYV